MHISVRKKRRERALFLTLGVMFLVPFVFVFSQFSNPSPPGFTTIGHGPLHNIAISADHRSWAVELFLPVTDDDYWSCRENRMELFLFGDIVFPEDEEIYYLEQGITLERRNGAVVLAIIRDKPLGPCRVLQRYNGYRVEFFRPGLEGKRIAIDPGHGGHDPGAIYPQGSWHPEYMEKTVTLAVSLELRRLLEEAGAEVFMTREGDTLVDRSLQPGDNIRPDLWMRRDIVDEWFPDFFVSVHVNSWKDGLAQGTEVYYSPQSFNCRAGKAAAHCILPRLVEEFDRQNRGNNPKGDAVLQSNDYAAVLVEMLFITNSHDRQILFSPDFPRRAARALFWGIEDYFIGGEQN